MSELIIVIANHPFASAFLMAWMFFMVDETLSKLTNILRK